MGYRVTTLEESGGRRQWSDDLLSERVVLFGGGVSVANVESHSASQSWPGSKLVGHIRLSGQPLLIEGLSYQGASFLLTGTQLSPSHPRWPLTLQGASSLDLTWTPLLLSRTPSAHEEGEYVEEPLEADPPPWLPGVVERLKALLRLPPDWDGYGGAPVDPKNALKALDFLARLMRPRTALPAISPLNDGGLQLDWHRGRLDVEVMFSEDAEAGLYWLDLDTEQEFEGSIDAGVGSLRRLMDRLEDDSAMTTNAAA